jgi:hypothetical protein
MICPILLFHLVLISIISVVHANGDFTIQAEKLVDWFGCDETTVKPSDIRAAWDSAINIAYVLRGKIEWDFHNARDFLGLESRNKDYQDIIKGKVQRLRFHYIFSRTSLAFFK